MWWTGHDVFKDLLGDAWNDTFEIVIVDVRAHHCESLTGTSLTVGKDGTVVTIEDIVDGFLDTEFEDISLHGVHREDSIEDEAASFRTRGGDASSHLDKGTIIAEVDDNIASLPLLNRVRRTETTDYLDIVRHGERS